MNHELLTADIPKLFPFLETILQDGGKKSYNLDDEISTFRNVDSSSGFRYAGPEGSAEIGFGFLFGGSGFFIYRSFLAENRHDMRFDHFNINGDFTFSSDSKSLEYLLVDRLDMDWSCPILNHLYNYLNLEYRQASEGHSSCTDQAHAVENFLRALYKSKNIHLPIQDKAKDSAVTHIHNKILQVEMDRVFTWEERQSIFEKYRSTIDEIMTTKIRAHKLSPLYVRLALFSRNISNFSQRVVARPASNGYGLLYKYTIGKVIWFFSTVKNNLGYSVALAVYGPFTYYFITMPMNPHAMQAVGKVRSAYLETRLAFEEVWNGNYEILKSNTSSIPEATADSEEVADSVSSQSAAPKQESANAKEGPSPKDQVLANVIYQSEVTMGKSQLLSINMGEGRLEKYTPSHLNMLLITDVDKSNNQNWVERMSNFKQLQIAYEENIEYASRMGRLEQLETQYNFPLQIENTWEELERYNTMIFKIRAENPNLSAKMKQYLYNEINRTQQLELYLWDRLGRFILDQPYVMLDQDKEQKRSDYYVGRAFVFYNEITNILSWRYKDFKKPAGHEKIQKMAEAYTKSRKELGSIVKNLEANSDLYKQKDVYDTKEFRAHMKRQWEILYLQNSKVEEASNNGLNMYIWSVRNTAWVLQSIFSAKREELALLVKRDVTGNLFSQDELLVRSKAAMTYETLIHNLTLEYVGIREEIMNRLGKDIESTQRMIVLDNLKEFLSDREKLDGLKMADAKKTAGNTL